MAPDKRPFATQLFINGVGIGETYQDWYTSEAEALADTRKFFEEKEHGATVHVEVTDLPRWPGTEPVRTFVVWITRAEVARDRGDRVRLSSGEGKLTRELVGARFNLRDSQWYP